MRQSLVALALAAALAVACGGGSSAKPTATPSPSPSPSLSPVPSATAPSSSSRLTPQEVEADNDPNLPGEYVDLPAIYGGFYGNHNGPNTNAHLRGPIDYSAQGLPPAGGPHWGSSACPPDPSEAPPNCGPVPWGIYRDPWPAESLVHNMEHAGVVIWYNTSNQNIIDDLERFATQQLNGGSMVVLVPYPDMAADTIAITVWSRRDQFPIGEYNPGRLQHFFDKLYCRFDPERFCRPRGGLTVRLASRYHLDTL